jgi:hypothetical protein
MFRNYSFTDTISRPLPTPSEGGCVSSASGSALWWQELQADGKLQIPNLKQIFFAAPTFAYN